MTHARIATVRTQPEAADDIARTWRTLLEAYRGRGGFEGLLSLYDVASATAVTVSLWESAAQADAAAEHLRPLAIATFGDLLVEAPSVLGYDVLVRSAELGGSEPPRG
jgi:heme-degrading monooxygenase HmoA